MPTAAKDYGDVLQKGVITSYMVVRLDQVGSPVTYYQTGDRSMHQEFGQWKGERSFGATTPQISLSLVRY
jgi:hypothetical protein